jgi:predicted membrane metal-binding protein
MGGAPHSPLACLYLVISGAAVPTQRAFVMVALGLRRS